MERDYAERMLTVLQSIRAGLEEADRITTWMENREEGGLLEDHLGEITLEPLLRIISHIEREHPDLSFNHERHDARQAAGRPPNSDEAIAELDSLVRYYHEGMFTRGEVAGKAMDLMVYGVDARFWHALPDWAKDQIADNVRDLSENSPVWRRLTPEQLRRSPLGVKAWLVSNGFI